MLKQLKDALLVQSLALPNGANTTAATGWRVNSTGFDFSADAEILIEAPALSSTLLPDAQTVTYSLYQSDNADFSGETPLYGTNLIVQTGASGAGAAAASIRVRPPANVKQYVRAKAVKTGAANASSASATVTLNF